MEDRRYDVIVIGAGPAGCRAAAVLAENGKRTALADCVSPGGTCLRTGCIPTKKLSLAAAGLRRRLREEPAGSQLSPQCPDPGNMKNNGSPANRENRHLKDDIRQTAWEDFLQETAQTAKEMTEGIRLVQMSRCVRLLEGEEVFPERGPEGLQIETGGEKYSARDIVLAPGSAPMVPESVLLLAKKNPSVGFYTTDTLREMKTLPDRLIVIGGGTAGCEIADAMSAFVPAVELCEAGEQILTSWSREPRRAVRRILERHGVRIRENCRSSDAWLDEVLKSMPPCREKGEKQEDPQSGLQEPDPVQGEAGRMPEKEVRTAVLTVVGRRPVFPARKAHALGLHLTQDGYIRADACGRTANPHVYCIGDANGQEKTAYYGTWQAEQAAELILQKDTDTGESSQLFPDMGWKTHSEADISREWEGMCAPACLHIDPPAACVGMSIEEIRARGFIIRTGKAPVYASGAARIRQYTDGSVTVWRDTKTDLLLGACVIAPEAEEMIHLLQSYILYRIPCSQICRQVFAHPSLSELVRMAVEDACGGSPELPVKRRR